MTLKAGDRFDRYVIEELLGEGGMARVYRAHDPRLHRRVALKVLRIDPSAEAEDPEVAAARVLREARAAAALDHPNAVAIFDVGEAPEGLFIAMEHVVGKSLRAYVADKSVPWDTKVRWMVDAARALGAAHDRGLVHRDVKPENIMVRSDGVVKVLDFGIAKRVAVELAGGVPLDEPRTLSMQGGLVGTPWYISPEQLRGDPVDGRADQFSWSVTAYELLTGILPWPKGVDGFQLVLAILNKTPPPPSTHVPELPSIVDATIMKALAKAATQRFDAMEFVVDALEGFATSSRRSRAEIHLVAMTKTDPAPPMPPAPGPTTDGTVTLPVGGSAPRAVAHSASLPEPSRATRARRLAFATGMLGVAAILGLGAAQVLQKAPAPPPPPVATPAPSASVPAFLALPTPRSSVPEALAAFRAYRQGFRDADWNAAAHALDTAVALDPSFAAAHLRLAFVRSLETYQEGHVRSSFHAAVQNRALLDERDTALLDALEPYLQRQPSDPLECEHRLAALHARWLDDPEIAYMLASVRYDRGELEGALEAFDAATRLDPGFAQALSSRGGVLAYLGRWDEARAGLTEAAKHSPTATEPFWYLAELAEQEGRCADQESIARVWLAHDPDDALAYQWLASALGSEGKSPDTVATALAQKRIRLDADARAKREPMDLAHVDLLTGDFTAAEAHLEKLEQILAPEPGAQAHAESVALRVAIAQETGKDDKAREIAASFLERQEAWSPTHRPDDISILMDPVPNLLAAVARGGGLSPAEAASRQDEWLKGWRARTATAYLGDVWLIGLAAPASTKEQAVAALAALPDFGGPPKFAPTIPAAALMGHALWLAGRTDEAIAALRAGVATCTAVTEMIPRTRASLELGRALEATGDREGACGAYGAVVARWSHPRPRSVTAEAARARARALGCK